MGPPPPGPGPPRRAGLYRDERFDDRIPADDGDAEPHLSAESRKFWGEFGIDILGNFFAVNYHESPISFFNSAMPSSSRSFGPPPRSEERRVGEEGRSRW